MGNKKGNKKMLKQWRRLIVAQQFRRPLAGHCKYRIQSRIRVDNETCIHDHRKDEFFETAPSEVYGNFITITRADLNIRARP